jgi:hypothetical protein
MSTFTINAIDREKGHVEVTYSIDGKLQKMCDAPLGDDAMLKAFLEDYGTRYEASLKQEEAMAPEEEVENKINALVGRTFNLPAGRLNKNYVPPHHDPALCELH